MFPPNDDESAAHNIKAILGDSALRERLAVDARSWAPRYSIQKSVADLTAVYDRYSPERRRAARYTEVRT
jgi:hypothetical protein